MLDWLEHDVGGLEAMEQRNAAKAALIYSFLDADNLFHSAVDPASRSMMNVVFDLPGDELAAHFSDEAKAAGLIGLDGHRTRGGFRASLYNAVTLEDVEALLDFMKEFNRRYG